MAAVERELILPHDGLALLFTPPFDRTPLDPGYIKGYPPGVRENGGQYTHAALWSVMAFAGLGEGDKAAALFSMLNPINHARTRTDMHRYKVEPYVVAADVYAASGHVGRGGWTWYTGSAGWMQRAGVESILGFASRATSCASTPAFQRPGPDSRSRSGTAQHATRSSSRTRRAWSAGWPPPSLMARRSPQGRCQSRSKTTAPSIAFRFASADPGRSGTVYRHGSAKRSGF